MVIPVTGLLADGTPSMVVLPATKDVGYRLTPVPHQGLLAPITAEVNAVNFAQLKKYRNNAMISCRIFACYE